MPCKIAAQTDLVDVELGAVKYGVKYLNLLVYF
jgi:hypothetical protein